MFVDNSFFGESDETEPIEPSKNVIKLNQNNKFVNDSKQTLEERRKNFANKHHKPAQLTNVKQNEQFCRMHLFIFLCVCCFFVCSKLDKHYTTCHYCMKKINKT